jgi:hypothetical protein
MAIAGTRKTTRFGTWLVHIRMHRNTCGKTPSRHLPHGPHKHPPAEQIYRFKTARRRGELIWDSSAVLTCAHAGPLQMLGVAWRPQTLSLCNKALHLMCAD